MTKERKGNKKKFGKYVYKIKNLPNCRVSEFTMYYLFYYKIDHNNSKLGESW